MQPSTFAGGEAKKGEGIFAGVREENLNATGRGAQEGAGGSKKCA